MVNHNISKEEYQAERYINSYIVYGYLVRNADEEVEGLLSFDRQSLMYIKEDTLKRINENSVELINCFTGTYDFLSNFYESIVEYDGIAYSNSESAFQAQKCRDKVDRSQFCNLSGGRAKRLGRTVKLRDDWDDIKDNIMYEIVKQKFNSNKNLRNLLIGTGNAELIEGNSWRDTYWGVCNGVGSNKLGKILMRVREELINRMED